MMEGKTETKPEAGLDHAQGCATVFALGKFDRKCARCAKIEKVIFLRRKTVQNGCSPEEQTAAGKIADTIIARYGLVAAEVIDRAYAPSVKAAEAEARKAAETERAQRAAEAKAKAEADAKVKAEAEARAKAADAKLAILKARMERAERLYNWRLAEYRNAQRDAGVSTKGSSTKTGPHTGTCTGDADSCKCRTHAAKRAWRTMRANGNGYSFGRKAS